MNIFERKDIEKFKGFVEKKGRNNETVRI